MCEPQASHWHLTSIAEGSERYSMPHTLPVCLCTQPGHPDAFCLCTQPGHPDPKRFNLDKIAFALKKYLADGGRWAVFWEYLRWDLNCGASWHPSCVPLLHIPLKPSCTHHPHS
eukprot:3134357-Prymnesium_polylepis.1